MDRPKPAGTCRTTGAQGVGRPADPREREIAIDTAQGLTHQEIARRTRRRPPRPPRWPPGVAGSTRHRPAPACAGRRSGRTPAPGAACKDAGAAHRDRTRLRQRASAARPRGVGPGSASQAGAQGIRSAGVKVPRGPHRARDMNMMNEPGPSARLRPPGRRGVLPPAVDVSPSRRDDSCICTMRAEAACPEHGPRAAAAAGEQEDTDGPPTHLADPLYRSTLPGRA